MFEMDKLYYYGKCSCKLHSAEVPVLVDTRYLPTTCDTCGGAIDWITAEHKTSFTKPEKRLFGKKTLRILLILGSILFTITLISALSVGFCLHRPYSPEEVSMAMQTANPMTVSEILTDFNRSDKQLAKVFRTSPLVIKRLRAGQTEAVPSYESCIRGAYIDFLLLNRSWLLFSCRYRRGVDPYTAYINPLIEK